MTRFGAARMKGMLPLAWIALALTLCVAHVTLVGDTRAWAPTLSLFLGMAVQGLAVGALLLRWRHSPGEAGQLWLMLAWAVLFQMLSNTFVLGAGLFTGTTAHTLQLVGTLLSGLYITPLMYMIARTFSRDMPWMVYLLDSMMVICAAVLLVALSYFVDTAPEQVMKQHMRELVFLADAVNYSLAALVSIRMIGSTTALRRFAFLAAAVFLWVHVLAVSGVNRFTDSRPGWLTALVDAAFLAMMIVAMGTCPRWLRRLHPSRFTVAVIDGFAPIVLSITVLALGIGVSRLNFGTGMIVTVVSVLFYGLRMAYLQTRDRDRERMFALSNERLQAQLGTDPLTGIANRVTLDLRLPDLLLAARTSNSPCSALMIDIDYFKQYNDHYGHIAGDRCLQHVVDAMRGGLLRAGDLVSRYGGEEFVVVLPDSTERAACKVAARLVKAVAAKAIPHSHSPYGRVTVSVGVATCLHCHPSQSIELLDAADRALYQAKHDGRNRTFSAGVDEDGWVAVADAPVAEQERRR